MPATSQAKQNTNVVFPKMSQFDPLIPPFHSFKTIFTNSPRQKWLMRLQRCLKEYDR